jgi:hypothetical protein
VQALQTLALADRGFAAPADAVAAAAAVASSWQAAALQLEEQALFADGPQRQAKQRRAAPGPAGAVPEHEKLCVAACAARRRRRAGASSQLGGAQGPSARAADPAPAAVGQSACKLWPALAA